TTTLEEPTPEPATVDKEPPAVIKPVPEETGRPKLTIKPSAYIKRLQSGEGTTDGTYQNGRPVRGKASKKGRVDGAMGEDDEDIEIGGVEFAMGAATLDAEGLDPKSLHDAKMRSDWPRWEEAMGKELDMLWKNKTWSVVERPRSKNIVGSKWVFHIKK